MTDKTYCVYAACPLKRCDRHLSRLQHKSKNEYVSVCDFAPTCREYLSYALDEVNKEEAEVKLRELKK